MAPAPPPDPTRQQVDIGWVHGTLAALLTLAYFSLFLFTMTDSRKGPPTAQKLKRNVVYRVCGYTILSVSYKPIAEKIPSLHPVFWLDSLAVEAFGVSWLVKGETILKDKAHR